MPIGITAIAGTIEDIGLAVDVDAGDDYNTHRPHSRLGWLTPFEFAERSRLSKQ